MWCKNLVYAIVLILCTQVVFSALTEVDDDEINFYSEENTLKTNDTITYYGKDITLISVGSTYINVKVDDESDQVQLTKPTWIDGVTIELLAVLEANQFRNASALVNYSVSFSCGNGICERSEGPDVCCTDCGCLNPLTCGENVCSNPAYDTCSVISDCDDGNVCTLDQCQGVPKSCSYVPKATCKHDDTCCPSACNEFNDNDCSPPPECTTNTDCDDNNNATVDSCSALTSKCKHIPTIFKEEELECREDADCTTLTETACQTAVCDDRKECNITTATGCPIGTTCVGVNEIYEGKMCDGSQFVSILTKDPFIAPHQYVPLGIIILEIILLSLIYRGIIPVKK